MAGTRDGGKKSAAKLLAKDPDYYSKLARKVRSRGRSANHPAVFEAGSDRARVAGAKGGKAAARARGSGEDAAQFEPESDQDKIRGSASRDKTAQ